MCVQYVLTPKKYHFHIKILIKALKSIIYEYENVVNLLGSEVFCSQTLSKSLLTHISLHVTSMCRQLYEYEIC